MQPLWPPSGRISTYHNVQFCPATSRNNSALYSLHRFVFYVNIILLFVIAVLHYGYDDISMLTLSDDGLVILAGAVLVSIFIHYRLSVYFRAQAKGGSHDPASQSPSAPAPDTDRQVGEQAQSGNVASARQSPDVDEDAIYAAIASELKTGATMEGLWTRAFAECDGDENRTKALYIKRRAETLIAEERKRVADERKRAE